MLLNHLCLRVPVASKAVETGAPSVSTAEERTNTSLAEGAESMEDEAPRDGTAAAVSSSTVLNESRPSNSDVVEPPRSTLKRSSRVAQLRQDREEAQAKKRAMTNDAASPHSASSDTSNTQNQPGHKSKVSPIGSDTAKRVPRGELRNTLKTEEAITAAATLGKRKQSKADNTGSHPAEADASQEKRKRTAAPRTRWES